MTDDEKPDVPLHLVPDDAEPNAPARIDQSPGQYPHVSRQESLRRRQSLTKLLFSYHPITHVYEAMRQSFGMTDRAIEELEVDICKELMQEDARRRPFLKSIRIRQLEHSIAEAAKEGAWPSVIKGSEQLAKMEGTLAPLAVDLHASGDVHHTHAFARLLSDMPQDEIRALIESERRMLGDGGDGGDAPVEVEVVPADGPINPD
jgi:hypothetical protein